MVSHILRDYLDKISEPFSSKIKMKGNGEDRAISYIMINTYVALIFRWTIGKRLLLSLRDYQEKLKLKKNNFNNNTNINNN
jgi:hypothetical protein